MLARASSRYGPYVMIYTDPCHAVVLRLALAALTRNRADENHVHQDIAVEYYRQRASTPGTLLITEGTFISADAGGFDNVPGIWNKAQIDGWKKVNIDVYIHLFTYLDLHTPHTSAQVTDAVHAKGSFIFCQLWALGRAAVPKVLQSEGYDYVSPSAIPLNPRKGTPRPLTVQEIKGYVEKYAQAARNAIEAGFDGVSCFLNLSEYLIPIGATDDCLFT